MKNTVFLIIGAIALVIAVAVVRALTLPGPTSAVATRPAYETFDGNVIAAHLAEAVRIKTVSWDTQRAPDAEGFAAFAAFLEKTYPAADAALTRETVNKNSLIYKWAGANTGSDGGKPIALIAHMDVVPVEPGTEDQWTRPPFSGAIYDGAVWGRGAMDNKGQLVAIMEAVERLASEGFKPKRDIYLLFGHDEELGGGAGAGEIAKLLKARGVRFAWTLDEGSGLVQGIIPGVASPIALIANGEKGSTTLRFTAHAAGGHSSAPGDDTAVSLVARAVVAVTDNPYPLEIDENVVAFLHAIAPQLSFIRRLALANLWLTGPAVEAQFAKDPATAAALHTTTAATIIKGGTKTNILPQEATAFVNYRIHPRDSVASVKARAIKLINDDRVTVEAVGGREPSPSSSITSRGYRDIEDSVDLVFGPVPTAPSLTLQGTDTRHYTDLADDNYRFTPFIYHSDDLRRIHGTDERVLIEDLARGAAWYDALLRKSAQ